MRARPGRNLVFLLAGLFGWSFVALVWPASWALIPIVLIVAAVAAMIDYRVARRELSTIETRRTLPTVTGRGMAFAVSIHLSAPATREMRLEIRDELPAAAQPAFWREETRLSPSQRAVTLTRSLLIPTRGRHAFGSIWIRLAGPLGMVELQQQRESPGSIKVLPETFHARAQLQKNAASQPRLLDKASRSRQRGLGTEFESLSEFRYGDDPRRIDWRSTARQRRLIVRHYESERHRDVIILVDCGRLMGADAERGTKLDCAVDAALILGQVALAGGDRCGVGMFDDQVTGYLPPVYGAGALNVLIDCVYDLQSRWHESDFSSIFSTLQTRRAKRALLIILSDIVDSETTERYRAAVLQLARRHVVLFVALRTPLLARMIHEPVNSTLDGARKMVAMRQLRDRHRAIHSLQRQGIDVLDVAPRDLTAPLIDRFLELRRRYLL